MADRIDTVYQPCDRAIKVLNREMLKDFGRLKLAKWDQLNVVRTVTELYRKSAERARRRYFEVAYEVYVTVLMWCHVEPNKAHRMAEKAITNEWVEQRLTETDDVALFRFDTETERKAQRLIEALAAAEGMRDREIDKAVRLWSRQVGQFAIGFTGAAALKAFADAGVKALEWVTQKDERVCPECFALDGRVFKVDEVPPKPHWGCRCFFKETRKKPEE